MIKSELILRIADQNPHLYERDAEAVVNTILSEISNALVAADRVELRRFGTFTVKAREAHTGRNPRTGAHVQVAEKRAVVFRPGKALQAQLNASEIPKPAQTEAMIERLQRHT